MKRSIATNLCKILKITNVFKDILIISLNYNFVEAKNSGLIKIHMELHIKRKAVNSKYQSQLMHKILFVHVLKPTCEYQS